MAANMTPAEWAGCDAPDPMIRFVHRQRLASARQWRLFACGCARLLDFLRGRSRKAANLLEAVAAAEAYADRKIRRADLAAFRRYVVAGEDAWGAARNSISDTSLRGKEAEMAALVRCVFGDPFGPLELVAAWRTPDVLTLAAAVYAEPAQPGGELDGVRLGILADALEDAGCLSRAALEHLRDGRRHVRGCHVVDAVLGRN